MLTTVSLHIGWDAEMNEVAVLPRGNAVVNGTDVAVETGNPVRADGRNRRAAETRRKIIEAAKVMIDETSEAPTVVGVARRADVSVRSVFQHFGNVQSLFVTIVDSVGLEMELPSFKKDGAVADRVTSLIEGLARLFDKIVPLRVAAGQFATHGALVDRSRVARSKLREATFEVFAPEFAALDTEDRERLADAIGAALSLDAWIVLRRRDGLSFERAASVWQLTLTALLVHGPGTTAAAA